MTDHPQDTPPDGPPAVGINDQALALARDAAADTGLIAKSKADAAALRIVEVYLAAAGPTADVVDVQAAATDPDGGLVRALAAAQAAFPTIAKTKTAKVKSKTGGEYSYTYADLADVLAAVRPVLARNGLALFQTTEHVGNAIVLRTYVRHVGGGSIESHVDLGQQSSNPQAFGGAMSYHRRYAIGALLGIAPEEDTDGQHVDTAPPPPARQQAPSAGRGGMPPWATEASDDEKRAMRDGLEAILGKPGANALGADTRKAYGYVPGVVAAFAAELGRRHAAIVGNTPPSPDDEATPPDAPSPDPAPHPPSPDPQPDPPSPEPAADWTPDGDEPADAGLPHWSDNAEPNEATLEWAKGAGYDLLKQTAETPRPPKDAPAPIHPVWVKAARDELARRAANPMLPGVDDAPQPATPAPGTVDASAAASAAESPDDLIAALRHYGCTCGDPRGAQMGDPKALDLSCPIIGHGMPA